MDADLHYRGIEAADVAKHSETICREIRDFYRQILNEKEHCKKTMLERIKPLELEDSLILAKVRNGFSLIDVEALTFDYPALYRYFCRLLTIIEERVPTEAERINDALENEQLNIEKAIRERVTAGSMKQGQPVLDFLLQETLKPVLECHAKMLQDTVNHISWQWGYCPLCGGDPFLSVLKNEEGTRWLICSGCAAEWKFPRIKCPFCETDSHKDLWYFTGGNDTSCRVEVCDACNQYIKTMDLRKTLSQEPLSIRNIETVHLDIIASDKGYSGTAFEL